MGQNAMWGSGVQLKIPNDQKAREMHNKHDEPDGEHNANSYFKKERQHPFECVVIVQDLSDVVTAIKHADASKLW